MIIFQAKLTFTLNTGRDIRQKCMT